MQGFFWMIAVIGAILGALATIFGIISANGAPQEAAAAAIGVAFAVIPYCLARGIQELKK